MSDTLMLIDGHSVAFRAFYGLPYENFLSESGQYTNAVYGFTSMLVKILAAEKPTHLAVAFDVSRHTFRTDEYAEYKGTRKETPEPFIGQVELIQELLDALGIVYLKKDDYEADDIIATLSTQGAAAGQKVLVVTGDRDALQLVNGDVTVLYTVRGVSDMARMTPAAVAEKYSVFPERYPELAALVGETSDNLPGVPGVGPKTAAKWLNEYDGLDNLLLHADEVKGKAGESFRSHIEDVKRNRRLNALVRNLELPVTIADLKCKPINREKAVQLFDQLQIRGLRHEVFAVLPQSEEDVLPPDETETFAVNHVDLLPGELADWLRGRELVGVDVVGNWKLGDADVVGLALADETNAAIWVDPTSLNPADEAAIIEWLADPTAQKVIHDVNQSLLRLSGRDWKLDGIAFDTLLAAYLLEPDQRLYDVNDLAIRYLKQELSGQSESDAESLLPIFDNDAPDAMYRARALLELKKALEDKLDERAQLLLHDLEIPLAENLAQMEVTGIAVDEDYLNGLRDSFDAKVQAAEQQAYIELGHPVNLASPKQLQVALFDELKMPKTKKTRTGYTTDAEALRDLFDKTGHPFLEQLLKHRDQIKLRQTVDGLIRSVGANGRIHTRYSQTQAVTGRLASADPNLQNIPVRTEAGRQIRAAFVPGGGYVELMTADYSQIEMRIMAHLSGDEGLMEAFNSGADFHASMAAHVFSVPADQVSPAQRAKIKAMNYGLAYGLGAYGLSQQLGIEVYEAKELMEVYFGRFGHVRDYLSSVVDQARKTGYTQTIFGRRRYLRDLNSTHRQQREMAERMALNSPIQGSAADIIKQAMLNVKDGLRSLGLHSRMLLQVHDELIFEVVAGESEILEKMVRDQMGKAVKLGVALEVSVGHGHSWQEAAH